LTGAASQENLAIRIHWVYNYKYVEDIVEILAFRVTCHSVHDL